jgi:hypothetical protein
MAFSRPQFHLSTLLWLTLAVACWFGGMRFERWRVEYTRPVPHLVFGSSTGITTHWGDGRTTYEPSSVEERAEMANALRDWAKKHGFEE